MGRVTIHLPNEVEATAREAAKNRGISLGRWISEQIAEKLKNTWPDEVLAAIGAFPDFPDIDQLRRGYGPDARRETLD